MKTIDIRTLLQLLRNLSEASDSNTDTGEFPGSLQWMIEAKNPEEDPELIEKVLAELQRHNQRPGGTVSPADPDRLLTIKEVADLLRVSARTVWNLVAEGALRPLYIKSSPRFTRESIDAYLHSLARSGGRRRR